MTELALLETLRVLPASATIYGWPTRDKPAKFGYIFVAFPTKSGDQKVSQISYTY